MISEGTRQLDLYDFFSVFLPGVTLLLGLVPFLPSDTNLDSLGVILLILVLGFVTGRAIHALAVNIESNAIPISRDGPVIRRISDKIPKPEWFPGHLLDEFNNKESLTHRGLFSDIIAGERTDIVSPMVTRRFLLQCQKKYDLEFQSEITGETDIDESMKETLYVLARSFVHADGRGRSRSFQAIYALYRSLRLVAIMWTIVYFLYVVGVGFELSDSFFTYTTYIESQGFDEGILIFLPIAISIQLYRNCHSATKDYREYFVQYLIVDFVVLTQED